MLEGSLFLFEGFLKEFLWNWRERGVEKGSSSEELGDHYLCARRVLALCASKVKLPSS